MSTREGINDVSQGPQLVLDPPSIAKARTAAHDHVDEQFIRFIQESADADKKGAAEIARGEYVTLEDLKRLIRER